MKVISGLAVAVAFCLALPAGDAVAQTASRERMDTTVTLNRGGTLSVSLYSGKVNVTGVSGSDVRIRGTLDRENLTFRARRSSVSISVEHGGHRSANGGELDITVPIGTRVVVEGFSIPVSLSGVKGEVSVETLNGSVTVNDAVGKVTVESVSGNIAVKGVEGDVQAESVSGRVELGNINGDINAESVSGRVVISGAKATRVQAETVQGDLSYEGTIEPMGNYSFTTHSGDLTLAVPASAGATVSLETFSGSVDSDFPVTLESGASRRAGESQFDFRIGDGKSRIVLETFNGNIRIQRGTGRANQE